MDVLICVTLLLVLIAALNGIAEGIYFWYDRYKVRQRLRQIDERIVRQAKASGTWDRWPIVLGGRALELKAEMEFNTRRIPGETDVELRRRLMKMAERPDMP